MKTRKTIPFLLVISLAATLAACGSAAQPSPIPTPEPDAGKIFVDSVDILMLESFPVQVNVVVKGNLSDGCTQINDIVQEREDNTFHITLATARPADQVCTQALVPFEEVVPLDVLGLEAGTYTVDVHGVTDSFTLDMDNVPPQG
jgi:inhibitor of cysteine peptidase